VVLAGIAFGIFYFLKKRLELQNQLQQEQQEAERLKELDIFKSQLFTNITHEFRTPLTVILGMAEQLSADGGRLTVEESKRSLSLIERNGQNLLRLINQLLDLSKLESKSFQLRLQRGNIVPYLRYVTESFHTYANSRNLSLRFFTTFEELEMDFDPEQIQQVMGNLVSNAIKFTPPGGEIQVRLTIDDLRWKAQESPIVNRKSSIVIQVIDTGIGISEADQPHIFDRFYQVDGSATRPGEGTGIGLAHAQELVRLMGGTISVESRTAPAAGNGIGSTFTVALPIRNEANPLKGPPQPSMRNRFEDLRQSPLQEEAMVIDGDSELPQLLVIEGNPDVVIYLKSILEAKYQVAVAYNGRIGIEMALKGVPDLIISDVMMPEKDGYQVLETLKNDERTSHVPGGYHWRQ
jgi:signal transduction histidine kinase